MYKVLVVCSGGLGTSLMLKMHVERILREWGINVWVEQADVGSATFIKAELIVGANQVVRHLNTEKVEVLGLTYVADRAHVEERLKTSTTIQKWRST
ncbi:PTS sugar transporter subunit IIB [Shouchella clausii]|uniref:PTS sugar transporter subunit IIB n=1 Tax=Shouchella clausii TaxID=79880 RepID=UPI000BA59205|nr:PTS sugar transporter subunit IIB [Shouchella clausii]MEB5479216.1 PTS sugar transporter subunit IIB [Shouchella clausii]PAD14642.1 hypothetical protein CHH74_08395 [Shouchella clausii]